MLAAAEEKEIGGAVQLPSQCFVDGIVRQHSLQLAGSDGGQPLNTNSQA